MLKHFQAALMMFSRLPLPYQLLDANDFKQSLIYLPCVGLVIGLIASFIYSLCNFFFPSSLALFFALVSGVICTGALHEDGFADCCDGFFASNDKDSILRIMRDSSNGSYASLGLIILFSGKLLFALSMLPELAALALISMHFFARFVPLWIVNSTPHCDGGQHKMSQGLELNSSALYRFSTISFLLAWLFLPLGFLLCLAIVLALCTYLLKRWFIRKLDGYNGDCLGASEQIAEALILLLFVAYF